MDAIREVKEWLFNKFNDSSQHATQDQPAARTFRPITPQSIPEFVIPGSNDSSRRTSDCSGPGDVDFSAVPKRNSYGGRSMSPPLATFRLSPSDSVPCLNNLKGHNVCKSAPVTPRHETRELIANCRNGNSTSDTDVTNVDPLSFAAMSLPHFRAQTSFGFSTLSEKPHTRRKESLFHVGAEGLLPKKHLSRLAKQGSLSKLHDNCSSEINILSGSNHLNAYHLQGRHMFSSSTPSVVITTFSQSRSQTPSPELEIGLNASALCNRRLSPTYQAFQGLNKTPLPSRHCRFYNRRRSSLVNLIDQESDKSDKSDRSENSSVSGQSTPSQNSIDLSNEPQRRSLGDLAVLKLPSPTLKRHSAPHIAERKPAVQEDIVKPRSHSFHVISKTRQHSHNQLFAPFGELKFSFQYLAASQQLKVTLIKAENLGGQSKQDRNINPYAKVYLMPGKLQRQTSQIFRRTKDPIFDQDMYFQNLSFEEIHKLSLKFKIFSKGTNLKFQELIGEVTIPMETYDVTEENRMWKDLESRKDREELGFLGVGLMFEPQSGQLTVLIDQGRTLPLHPIYGPPDPYVKIEISQMSKPVAKRQTKILKKTPNPVFEETFAFPVSTKQEDIDETTVTITVYDKDRLRTDEAIGHVILGYLATEACQYGHWQEMMENPGFMSSKWHYLVDYDE